MSRRIRTRRQAAAARLLAEHRLIQRGFERMLLSAEEQARLARVASNIQAGHISANRIMAGFFGQVRPPLYRVVGDMLGDPVIDWEAEA